VTSPSQTPEATRAHRAVSRAVRAGHLIPRVFCEHCGYACYTVAHHEDYRRPLDVAWLCGVCHRRAHGLVVRDWPRAYRQRPDPILVLIGRIPEFGEAGRYRLATALGGQS